MIYFEERGYKHNEILSKIYSKYGRNAKILNKKTIYIGGFLGLFKRECVEYTGYVSERIGQNISTRDTLEKKAILEIEKKKDNSLTDNLLKEMRALQKKLSGEQIAVQPGKHENIEKLEELLENNDFSHKFISYIIDRLKSELSLKDLEDYSLIKKFVLKWIGDKISIYKEQPDRVFVLVGPTGVGKTTTVAKLAAINSVTTSNNSLSNIRILTIDNYRIGAREQMEIYGRIMEIPVSFVESFGDLKKEIQLYGDADLLLVDTIGKSPGDIMKLAEMRDLLSACGSGSEVHLAISATTKTRDVKEILSRFEPFNYKSVILTKLDETIAVGNIISILAESGKSISYITYGQVVPLDIEEATKTRFLEKLTGF